MDSGSLDTEKNSDYGKIATALGKFISDGISISLIDINKSNYTFEPDVENNQILFGLKAVSGINSNVIETIFHNRPYKSFKDFLARCPLNKTQMISLIKSGAFDNLEVEWAKELNIEPRILIMVYYLSIVSEPKQKITLQNFNSLIQKKLIPQSLKEQKEVFLFNRYLKTDRKVGKYYAFDSVCENFYNKRYDVSILNIINGISCIEQKTWDKIYQNEMEVAREWIKNNQDLILKEFNQILFKEIWDKYAAGNISAWEMDSLCFYYHEHELINVNTIKYGISNFFGLPAEPEIDYLFKKAGRQIPIYKIFKIVGTVIDKDDIHSSISLLTINGVVNIRFTKEYYAMYNRQISEIQDDGKKKVIDKSWFARGTKLMISGFRRDNTFIAKRYKKTAGHTLYKIIDINNEGDLVLVHDRDI